MLYKMQMEYVLVSGLLGSNELHGYSFVEQIP